VEVGIELLQAISIAGFDPDTIPEGILYRQTQPAVKEIFELITRSGVQVLPPESIGKGLKLEIE
jgi:hypothetical protein